MRRGGAGHSVPILLCLSPVAGALRGLSTADTSSLTTRRDPAHYPLHYPFALRRSIAGKLPAITGAAARVPFDWTNSRASSTARNYYEQSSHQASTLWHTPHVCQTSAVLSQPGHFSSNIIISPSTAGGGPAAAHLLELPAAAAVCDGHLRVAAQPARQPHHAGPALLPVLGARCSAADGWGTIPEFYRLLFPSPCLHIHCCSFADPCVTSVLLGAAADRRRGHVLVQHRYALSRHTKREAAMPENAPGTTLPSCQTEGLLLPRSLHAAGGVGGSDRAAADAAHLRRTGHLMGLAVPLRRGQRQRPQRFR